MIKFDLVLFLLVDLKSKIVYRKTKLLRKLTRSSLSGPEK
jgi:hypothetical protein